jgi:peptidoglycan/LPS O-acetylase OafA/YrhL
LVAGLLMWANRRLDSWFDADLLGIALSVFAIAQIGMWLMDINNEALSADYGVYVSLAGAVIAFVGGLVALLGSRSDRVTTEVDRSGDVSERRVA